MCCMLHQGSGVDGADTTPVREEGNMTVCEGGGNPGSDSIVSRHKGGHFNVSLGTFCIGSRGPKVFLT